MEKLSPWFLHVDLDAFFASVEQLDHPEYKGKPVIVGGKPEDRRSVVSTASYEARKFGVHSAMPTYQAYKLCPQGIYVYGRMKRYSEISYQIMSIFREYSPEVIQMSIDEAFINLTGTEKLFGPPEETAMKIKAHVKKCTGLTVSVGLASTKYLAKIASGFSKPDGFYFVKPGTEQEFMLNLPLNKVWGVGEKTLESLKKSGIYTTRDIYDKSYDSLEFLFGKNTANFLYNVVRGIDTVGFGHESKKHSISAESTFPYDITDSYTAETQLLDLCHGVVFRLIRENGFSRTAFVKIRYDDFSTVSIQETYDRNILTVDSFFEKITKLFEQKYEKGRGIRLLGVGFDNIEKEDKPYQQDLFDSGNEKKQAVEQAILKLEKKHPEVKIQKARLLKNTQKMIIGLLCSSLWILTPAKVTAQETKKSIIKGAGSLLPDNLKDTPSDKESQAVFDWDINDENVELQFSGYWLFDFANILNTSFGNGTRFAAGFGLPVFTQEIDLSSKLLLNKTWYFEADFADLFEKNTLAMGYIGNGYLKSARVSNRGINMPLTYSANLFNYGLGGGDNQSPGFSLHFSDLDESRWYGDFLLRYDMTKTNSATFYGKNSVTDISISPENFVYGKYFVFPKECDDLLFQIKDIYLENQKGTYKDANGKKYIKLAPSDYVILKNSSKLVLSSAIKSDKTNGKIPYILITFTDSSSVQKIISATGTYDSPDSFAGQIQEFFNTSRSEKSQINLQKFALNPETTIENETALVIQSSSHFSPYLCASIYDCGLLTSADVFVMSDSTNTQNKSYYAEIYEKDVSALNQDFIFDNHLFAQVSNLNNTDNSLQNPASRYPFADTNPEIYLNLSSTNDIKVVARSYSPVSVFDIGTKAVSGSVQVYVNNLLDTGASYNQETGTVELSVEPGTSDKIYIVWQEDASNFANGSIAAGTGLFFNFTPSLSFDFALTTRWPTTLFEKYSTTETPVPGFTAFSAGLTYSKESLTLSQKTSLSINSDNATGTLLVMTQDESLSKTYYLSNSDGYETKAEPIINSEKKLSLEQENNRTIVSHGGKNDSKITGYKIPLSWSFQNVSESDAVKAYNSGKPYWASVDVKLSEGQNLKNTSLLELGLQPAISAEEVNDYEIYLQLGITASEDFYGEASDISAWKLSDLSDKKIVSSPDFSQQNWQTAIISLSDEDRAKLCSEHDARLVVVYNPVSKNGKKTGTIYFGPYEPKIKSIFTQNNDKIIVQTFSETAQTSPSAKKLALSENYATKLQWHVTDTSLSSENSTIKAFAYFDAADFSSYSSINFDFDSTTCGKLTISLDSEQENAIKLELPDISKHITVLKDKSENPVYHQLSLEPVSKKLFIDGVEISASDYELTINNFAIPNKFTVILDTISDSTLTSDGAFYIGSLYYSDSSVYMGAQNYFYASYKKNGTIAKIKDFEILKNAYLQGTSTQSINSKTSVIKDETKNFTTNVNADFSGGITFAGIRLETDISTQNNAGHNIKTDNQLFNFLSFGENYRFNGREKSLNKKDLINFDFSNPYVPVQAGFTTEAKSYDKQRNQNSTANVQINANLGETVIGLAGEAKFNQKINDYKSGLSDYNTENYFAGWKDISLLEFSGGEEGASSRNQTYNASLFADLPYFSLKPELNYELQSVYENHSESVVTDVTTISLLQPVQFEKNSFSFNIKRTGTGTESCITGGSYFSDAQAISKSYSKRTWVYSSIPIYDLWDKSISEKIQNSSSIETASYASIYELSWKRSLMNNYKDLFIPSSTSIDFSREIKAGITQSDLYQLKCVITNTAINCFGKQSNFSLFNWYDQDEFISSVTTIFKIPGQKDTSPTFTISAYNQLLFYLESNSSVKAAVDYTLDTSLNWASKLTGIYSRNSENSLIKDGISLLAKDNEKMDFKISRKDVLNISFGQTDKQFHQQYDYKYSTDVNFLKYYTLTAGIGSTLTMTQNQASVLSLNLNIGGKIEF